MKRKQGLAHHLVRFAGSRVFWLYKAMDAVKAAAMSAAAAAVGLLCWLGLTIIASFD